MQMWCATGAGSTGNWIGGASWTRTSDLSIISALQGVVPSWTCG